VGSSGRSATGGPVFRKADFANAKRVFPDYYEGKWLITDFMRGWIMAVTLDENENYKSMEQFLPNENFSSAIDMKFGPDGDLYVLEYGSAWFRGNANSKLLRIEYNSGNRKPVVQASAEKTAGAIPFTVHLSSKGTNDFDPYDKDALKYEWKVTSGSNTIKTSSEQNPNIILDQPGNYQATLTVTDTKGEKNSKTIELRAGNEPPQVSIDIGKGNKTFFFANQPINYSIQVSDKEDGSLADGKIKPGTVAVNFDYVPEGFDIIDIASHHVAADDRAGFSAGLYLINSNDCKTCHMPDKKSVGPSYFDIAQKYIHDAAALNRLASKVISGGVGVWGEHAMAAHPQLSQQDAEKMVKYILSVGQKQSATQQLPLKGTYIARVPAGEKGQGGYLLRASYTDKGNGTSSSLSAENIIALRNPALNPELADEKKSVQLLTTPVRAFYMIGNNSYIAYDNIDLTGIKEIDFLVQATPNSGAVGGTVEVHLDSPDGKLIGQTDLIVPKEIDFARLMENMGGNKKEKSKAKPKAGAKNNDSADKKPPEMNFDFDIFTKLMSVHAIATLAPTPGAHKIYLVCKNDKAGAKQILLQMVEVGFRK
jgi:cytochrome c